MTWPVEMWERYERCLVEAQDAALQYMKADLDRVQGPETDEERALEGAWRTGWLWSDQRVFFV